MHLSHFTVYSLNIMLESAECSVNVLSVDRTKSDNLERASQQVSTEHCFTKNSLFAAQQHILQVT